jgi:DNA-binding transcriptional ArsR family regulator
MDLDFKSVKALSSPTRLEILNKVLEEEATTTKLSDELDKSKSTVSSHLKVLSESGLLEKEKKDGRRRVVYRPTQKAEAIVKGKERKVRFSVISSALTGFGGIFLLGKYFQETLFQKARLTGSRAAEGSGGGMGTMDTGGQMAMNSMDAANTTAEAASQTPVGMQEAVAVIGIGLVVTSALALGYSYILSRLRSE